MGTRRCWRCSGNRRYVDGDVARAYLGDKLLTDDFYNSQPFEIGLRRYGPNAYQDGIVLKILPLRQDAPIYITDPSQLKFGDNHTALTLDGVDSGRWPSPPGGWPAEQRPCAAITYGRRNQFHRPIAW